MYQTTWRMRDGGTVDITYDPATMALDAIVTDAEGDEAELDADGFAFYFGTAAVVRLARESSATAAV
jgi:hypothetical protein